MRRLPFSMSCATCLCLSSLAPAQTASQKAAAEALFHEGVELMDQGRQTEACEKYQASQELDPALGTLLRLADCYDRIGKTASAWALFVEAKVVASRSEQGERAEMAGERAADLKQRLSLLTLDVSGSGIEGLTVWVNGTEIPRASWGTPLPVDPGPVKLEAKAPNFRSWSGELEVEVGPAQQAFRVPKLEAEPTRSAGSPPASAELLKPRPSPTEEQEPVSSTQSTLGYVVGTAGLVGLAGAGVLSYRAHALNQDSLEQCATDTPNACTEEGKRLRDDAVSYGSMATIASGVGGGLLLTGLLLVLTAPSEEEPASASSEPGGLRLAAGASPDGAALTLRGVW